MKRSRSFTFLSLGRSFGGVAILLGLLAGCSGPTFRQKSGPRKIALIFSPDPAVVTSERAPLGSLTDARGWLTDAANSSKFRALLGHMTGGKYVEVETVAATFTATETYLARKPLPPAIAAVRVDPWAARLEPKPDGSVKLEVKLTFGEAVSVSDEVTNGAENEWVGSEDADLAMSSCMWGDRSSPLELAIEDFLQKRAHGWLVLPISAWQDRRRGDHDLETRSALDENRQKRIDDEVERGRWLWPR